MAYYQAAVAIAGLATTIKAGEDQKLAQKRNLQAQERATQEAKARAITQARLNDQEILKANRAGPDITGLLDAERAKAKSGAGGTLLSGPLGVATPSLKLGRPGLLGSP